MTSQIDDVQDDLAQRDAPPRPAWHRAHLVLLAAVGVALVVWLCSGIYQVQPSEVAIIERLGAFVSQEGSGTHLGLPWPIDRVHKINREQAYVLKVDTFNRAPAELNEFYRAKKKEGMTDAHFAARYMPYLITGDKNVIHISVDVVYRIAHPRQFMMSVAAMPGHPQGMQDELLRRVVEHQLIERLSTLPVDSIIGPNSAHLPGLLQEAIEASLSQQVPADNDPQHLVPRFGVQLQQVNVVERRPPMQVAEAFDLVGRALSQRQADKIAAQTRSTAMLSQARSTAQTMDDDAIAASKKMVDAATGERDRFLQLYERYQKEPLVTKLELYSSVIREVLDASNRTFFVNKNQRVVIPVAPVERSAITTPPSP